MFLVDTDVLSDLRRRARNPAVVRWIESQRTADLLIAATALEHGLTVATRNVRHFKPTGVPVLDLR